MEIVGVKISDNSKILYYDTNNLNLKINLTVIVNTARGLQFATVVQFLNVIDNSDYDKVIRIATKKDYLQHLLLVWIEDAIEDGFFTPQYELRARTMVDNGDYALKVDNMLQQRFIENALSSTEIEDYTPYSVFKEILSTEYNSILF